MSASPWCVWVKNRMLKRESLEKVHLAEGMWRFWSFFLIWEWVVWSALFCFLVPVGAMAQSGQICKYKSHGKKHLLTTANSSLRFCCLVTNFWEMVSGGGKHIFISEYSVIDDWYGCAKKKKTTWVLPTAELLTEPAEWDQWALG